MTTTRPDARVRRRVRALAISLIAAVAITACGSSNDDGASGAASSSPVDGGTLTLYTNSNSNSKLSPYNNRDFARPLVDSLVYQDAETLKFSPWLATSWEVNEDGSVYTFRLRDDVTFSDGAKLDAEAVKANFDFAKNVVVPAGGAYFRDVFDHYDRTETVDPLTVTVHFTQGNVPFLTMLATAATGIISPASLTKSLDELNQGAYAGSGPFTLTSFQPGSGMVFDKRADYNWGPGSGGTNHTGPAYLDRIEFKFVDETGVSEGAVQSGQADLVTAISTDGARNLALDDSIQLFSRPQPGTQNGSQWNFNRPIPSDVNVRRALQLAIDRDTLSSAVTGPSQTAGTSPLEPSNLGYQDLSGSLAYDPDQAKQILDKAGWTAGADGIRQKNGQRLVVTSVSFDQGSAKTLMQLVKEQAQAVGIDVELTFDNNWSADWRAGKYDLLSAIYQTSPDSDILRSLFSDSSANTLKGGNPANNEELTAVLDRQVSVPDATQRAELLGRAQELIVNNSLYLVLNEGANVGAATSKVHGVDNFTTFSVVDLYNVWKSE